jgi:mitofusin
LNHLGSALSDEKLDSNSLVRVLWPKEKCRLLKEDVVFVDSPGIDVSSDLDGWIDQQCLDADVFVLVVNAESTLTKTEKEFFNKVNERLSKPNVFILNNRWDATAYEPESSEEVKRQHMERNTEFLVDELKVCDRQEVNNRIYFVSAREVLLTRTQTNPQLPPGHQSRLLQFEWFEGEFEKCISMSAVKTKFDQPSQRGKAMASLIRKKLEDLHQNGTETKAKTEKQLKDLIEKIELIEKKLQDFTQDMKEKIRSVMEEVERNVSFALNDEIKRIYNLIDEYERPFHPEEHQLNWYKKELHKFVENRLGSNLSSRLNNALIQNLEQTQHGIRSNDLIAIFFYV